MKENAPERLYLSKNIYSTFLYQVPDPNDDTAVEYTRTDAFIEKACQWFKSLDDSETCYETTEDFINAFRKVMEE